jgi:hypothetical protein
MAISAYNHIQSDPSNSWTITHNLNTTAVNLDVVILDDNLNKKILPGNIITQDNNTIIVTFTTEHTGSARVIGTQIVL